jgi:quinol monooxygenase YgiN
MVEPSLAEEGCLAYRPYADPSKPGAMVIIEEWVDKAALDFHFTTPHFHKVAAALKEILAEPFQLKVPDRRRRLSLKSSAPTPPGVPAETSASRAHFGSGGPPGPGHLTAIASPMPMMMKAPNKKP